MIVTLLHPASSFLFGSLYCTFILFVLENLSRLINFVTGTQGLAIMSLKILFQSAQTALTI